MAFELRVICDPADAECIIRALNAAFTTSAVRGLPSRYTTRTRLYITAELPRPSAGHDPEH